MLHAIYTALDIYHMRAMQTSAREHPLKMVRVKDL